MENPRTEISVEPSSAAVISPPLPPPPPGRMERLKAVSPWFDLVSAALLVASLSSIFLEIRTGNVRITLQVDP